MGRAGGGSSGGSRSHSSGGGHSSGRSGGGHRVSSSSRSSSRAGAGRSSFSSGSSSRSGRNYSGSRNSYHRGYGSASPRYGYGGSRRSYSRPSGGGGGCGSVIGGLIALAIIVAIVFFVLQSMNNGSGLGGQQAITHNRTKLESGISYNSDCIIDELGWFDSVSMTESELKNFYDETGVQPYIYLKSYDPSLTTDEAKDDWTIDYYDANFKNENIFLYVYFAEQDTDNDVGYMSYANGQLVDSVMDDEAVEIFWNNIDRYWYTDYSTDQVFIRTFNDTADTIMADVNARTNLKTTITKGIVKVLVVLLIVVAVIVVGILLIVFWTKKKQREKEEAEETERILNTPMQDLVNDQLKDLEEKYK